MHAGPLHAVTYTAAVCICLEACHGVHSADELAFHVDCDMLQSVTYATLVMLCMRDSSASNLQQHAETAGAC